VRAGVVESAEVGDDGQFGLEARLERAALDEFGLEGADEALGHGVVVGVRDRADRRGDGEIGEALGIAEARVLPGLNRSSQRCVGELN
jgi:hypothetical protein